MVVPIFDLTRQWRAMGGSEIMPALEKVMVGGQFILGEQVALLEDELAARCGVAHGVGVANGSDALFLALRALDVGPGDEVIVPAFTFFATASAVVRAGATPVFADIDPVTYCIDVSDAARRVTERTKAIIPVHLYGHPADMDAVMALAGERQLWVVEDAAQSIESEYQGRRIGSFGHAACLSFYPTKNLGCCGDGGMVVTSNEKLAERLRILRVHGSQPKYFHKELGINSRLDEMQAAILLAKLPHLSEWTARRRAIAAAYSAGLAGVPGLQLPVERPGCRHVYHQYTVAWESRDGLRSGLECSGIGTAVYYPLALHLQEVFVDMGYGAGDLPAAEGASRRVLSLPMFPELTDEEVERVVRVVRATCC